MGVPILIELKKKDDFEKKFQPRALKNSSKNLIFQEEKELFPKVQIAQFLSEKILDLFALVPRRTATKNQWPQLFLVVSLIKINIFFLSPVLIVIHMRIRQYVCQYIRLICSINMFA